MAVPRILVIGSGGREHALAWRLARDPEASEVWVAPGNDGMAQSFRRLAITESDHAGIVAACRREAVDLVVVGPEAPLAAGLADALRAEGIAVYGPGREGAQLESSKWYAKQRMREAGVPTARAEAFDAVDDARAALGRFGPPYVVKADGLAAGKGVCVTSDRATAEGFLAECFSGRFGPGGTRVVLEEPLAGEELSVMAVCDGSRAVLLAPARDYKRAQDGDAGPNTGGMGAYAPSPLLDAAGEREVLDRVVRPVLEVMSRRNAPYRGTLYVGLMRTAAGLRVVEFNCRFGDPEAQVILPLTGGSLGRLLQSAAHGAVDATGPPREPGAAVAVAIVDEGYPDRVAGGGTIRGLDEIGSEDVFVFHAATRRAPDGWRVAGGRAAYVCARGTTRDEARMRAYAAVGRLAGSGWRHRSDIAADPRVSAVLPGSGGGDG